MFKDKLSKGLICLWAIGVLASTGWTMGKEPAQEQATVEKPQAVTQPEAKENPEVAQTESEPTKATEEKGKMNISKSCTCKEFIGNIRSREEICKKIPQLIKQLNCPRSFHRERAIILLSRSGDPRAVKPLIDAMLNDKDEGLRAFATVGLRNFASDVDKNLALKEAFEKDGIPVLNEVLKSENREVRSNAAMTLYKLGEIPIAISAFEDLLKEGYLAGFDIFARLGPKGKLVYDENAKSFYMKAFLNYKDESIRIRAASGLINMEEKELVYPFVIKSLRDSKNADTRRIAVNILKDIGDEKAILGIQKALDDSNSFVRQAAENALKELKREDLIKKYNPGKP